MISAVEGVALEVPLSLIVHFPKLPRSLSKEICSFRSLSHGTGPREASQSAAGPAKTSRSEERSQRCGLWHQSYGHVLRSVQA